MVYNEFRPSTNTPRGGVFRDTSTISTAVPPPFNGVFSSYSATPLPSPAAPLPYGAPHDRHAQVARQPRAPISAADIILAAVGEVGQTETFQVLHPFPTSHPKCSAPPRKPSPAPCSKNPAP